MPSAANGLQRDVRLIRRRAWVFIPFLILGIIAAFLVDRVAGDANAVAEMALETVVNDALISGDRGLRVFEAQAMTSSDEFIELVKEEADEPDLDYARFDISLNPISVADGVSRGDMTVSIQDSSKSEAERLRDAWVTVFVREYTEPDGLFRTRYIDAKVQVAADTNILFREYIGRMQEMPEFDGIPIDEIVRPLGLPEWLIGQLNAQIAEMMAELDQVNAALETGATGAQASAILGVEVADGNAGTALTGRAAVLEGAITEMQIRRAQISDDSFSAEALAAVDEARSLWNARSGAYERLNNARVAVTASQSTVEVTYTSSGGIGGTWIGRLAVVLGVTVVFGLITIYLLEWLSQVRRGTETAES